MQPEKIVRANGVALCAQEFGAPTDPGILLIAGAASSMDWWEDEFCERIAVAGRRVVRYDLRDTGRSTASPAGKPDYTARDLVDDAVALLEALGLAPAHIVGLSMGGGIAQHIAVEHPHTVATLTLMSTSPAGPGGSDKPDLPPPAPHMAAVFTDPPPEPDWTERAATIDYLIAGLKPFAGGYGVDEQRVRVVATRMYDRTTDVAASQTNHWILDGGGESIRDRLGDITAPTLVLHGTDDPLFPIAHAEALAHEIPDATLLQLPRVGHEYPPAPTWDTVVAALLRHTAAAGTRRHDLNRQ
jgi:pimeloyl-ACP methyl ester carboxylesterase